MPRVISGSGSDGSFESYYRLGREDAQLYQEGKDRALRRKAFEADFERAAQEYQRAEADRMAQGEYAQELLQQAGQKRAQGLEPVYEEQATAASQGALQAGGLFAAPAVSAMAAMVPELMDGIQQEVGRLQGIAERMSPEHAMQLVADYEAQTVSRLREAAGQKVLGKINTMRERGQLALEGDQPGPDGQSQGMSAQIEQALFHVEQGLQSGELDPLQADQVIAQARQAVVQENTRRQFVQMGLKRVEREIEAVEPASQDAEELAFVRSRWIAGDIENGDDLEDAIFEARTGRKTARAQEPKTPQELYLQAAEMMLKVNPKATQEQIDQAFQVLAAGPPAQRPGAAPPRRGVSPGKPVQDEQAYLDAQAAERERRGMVGYSRPRNGKKAPEAPERPQAEGSNGAAAQAEPAAPPNKGGKGAPPDVFSWDEAPRELRTAAKEKLLELLQEPGGSLMDIPNEMRAIGIRLGSIPPEVIAQIRKEVQARKAKDKSARTKEASKRHSRTFEMRKG